MDYWSFHQTAYKIICAFYEKDNFAFEPSNYQELQDIESIAMHNLIQVIEVFSNHLA